MQFVSLKKASVASGKKYVITLKNEEGKVKKTSFGDSAYDDFTIHHDLKRKKLYLARHKKEGWTDLFAAGTLSRYILWNKKSIEISLADYLKRFHIKRLN